MITLEGDELVFRFPELHPDARFSVSFQRTLRIPDDGHDYFLPPGLGCFPLRHVDDYGARLPASCIERGGVLLPMYQAEALWLNFSCLGWPGYPMALKVATGKVNAVTGGAWASNLGASPQDYLVLPDQPWLDGYCVENGVIRQFVAAPMGKNITVEEQVTGAATWGGIQLVAYPMKAEKYDELRKQWDEEQKHTARFSEHMLCCESATLGLAAGGRMRQHIYADPYDFSVWDQQHGARCFVTILDSRTWTAVTGEAMPTKPITAKEYTSAGLPWFDYYSDAAPLDGSSVLNGVQSIAGSWKQEQPEADSFDAPIPAQKIVALGRKQIREMRD
jgi:hypothetical protein